MQQQSAVAVAVVLVLSVFAVPIAATPAPADPAADVTAAPAPATSASVSTAGAERRSSKLSAEVRHLAAQARAGETSPRLIEAGDGDAPPRLLVRIESDPGRAERTVDVLDRHGGSLTARYRHLLLASVPVDALDALVASDAVRFIRTPVELQPGDLIDADRADPAGRTAAGGEDVTPQAFAGNIRSEGLDTMNVTQVHQKGITGQGVDVAVIDFYFNVSNPEIKENVVGFKDFSSDPWQNRSGEHGTATAEVVVDVAPGAGLHLLAARTEIQLLNAFQYVIDNDIDVAVMSLGSLVGPFDGSALLDRKADDVVANGTPFFISAGNAAGGNHLHFAYSDPDNDSVVNATAGFNDSTAEEFIEVDTSTAYNRGGAVRGFVNWNDFNIGNDLVPNSTEDYDVLLWNSTADPANNTLVWRGNTTQNGSQPAYEMFFAGENYRTVADNTSNGISGNLYLQVINANATGSPDTEFDIFTNDFTELSPFTNARSITSPATAEQAAATGAVYFNLSVRGLESFSSRGPTIDGRRKPMVVAPDGVSNSIFGTYFGTSAAAPHAGGVAALVMAANASVAGSEVQSVLARTAVSVQGDEPNNRTGNGLVDANAAVNAVLPQNVTVTGYTVSGTTLRVNETLTITATVLNAGPNDTNITVPLSVDNRTVENRTVSVPADSSMRVNFTVSFATTGPRNVTVADLPPTRIEVFEGDLYLEDVEAGSGENVTVRLYVENVSNVAGYQTNITFDPSVVHVTSLNGSADFGTPVANVNNQSGWVNFTQSNANGTADPVLATITFAVVGDRGNATALSMVRSGTNLNGPATPTIPVILHNGSVTVPDVKSGDVTGDGTINTGDVIQVQRDIVGLTSLSGSARSAADVTGDGTINTGDVIQIQRFIVGLSSVIS